VARRVSAVRSVPGGRTASSIRHASSKAWDNSPIRWACCRRTSSRTFSIRRIQPSALTAEVPGGEEGADGPAAAEDGGEEEEEEEVKRAAPEDSDGKEEVEGRAGPEAPAGEEKEDEGPEAGEEAGGKAEEEEDREAGGEAWPGVGEDPGE
jgi:hypothetical protein